MANTQLAAEDIRPRLLSHGTLECKDLERSRRFYRDVLGLQAVKTGPISLWLKLGSDCFIVALALGEKAQPMPSVNWHWGLDVGSVAAVDAQYERLLRLKDEYGIGEIKQPSDMHGAYSFYFEDCDHNWWEIQYVPDGTYERIFSSAEDLEGRGIWATRPSKEGS